MKFKSSLLAGFLFITTFSVAIADSPIRGTMYGENFGLIHANWTTAYNPFSTCEASGCSNAITAFSCNLLAPSCLWNAGLSSCDLNSDGPLCPAGASWDKYHVGARSDFYISPGDIYQTYPDGDLNNGASIENIIDCDPDVGCALSGYLWSDAIGWTVLDGQDIEDEVNTSCTGLNQSACENASYRYTTRSELDDDTSTPCQWDGGTSTCEIVRPFTPLMHGRVNFAGIFDGFVWNRNAGWIQLSSCANKDETECNADSICEWDTESVCKLRVGASIADLDQVSRWGIYVDLDENEAAPLQRETLECSSAVDKAACDAANPLICNWNDEALPAPGVCETLTIELGRPLHGFAWSEHLGWISFGGDPEYGAFTSWVPDTTPPAIAALTAGERWFANDNGDGLVNWLDFAVDPESGIDSLASTLNISADPDLKFETEGCPFWANPIAPPLDSGQAQLIPDPLTKSADLTVYSLGQFDTAGSNDLGYCKYLISGTIVNGAGLETDIPPSDPIVFYVRAGDLDLDIDPAVDPKAQSTLELASVNASGYADGGDYVEYQFHPKDVAGNVITPVRVYANAGTYLDDPEEDFKADWVRDVTTSAQFDIRSFHYNTLEDPLSVKSFLRPLRIASGMIDQGDGDFYPESMGVDFDRAYPDSPNNPPEPTIIAYPEDPVKLSRPTAYRGAQFQLAAFAPTNGISNAVKFASVTFQTVDDTPSDTVNELVRSSVTVDGANSLSRLINDPFDQSATSAQDPEVIAIAFDSPILIDSGTISTAPIITAVPPVGSYRVRNASPTVTINNLAIDHLFKLTGGQGILDVRDVARAGGFDTDSKGRYEFLNYPMNLVYFSKYELFRGTPFSTEDDATDTVFHTPDYDYFVTPGVNNTHTYLSDLSGDTTAIGPDGAYLVSDIVDNGDAIDPPNVPIDRSDFMAGFELAPGASQNIAIDFEILPVGNNFSQAEFSLDQYVAYRAPDPMDAMFEFAVFEQPSVIAGIEIKSVGLQTTGNIKGENVFNTVGGEYEVFSGASTTDLQKTMRSNAAELSRNITPCPITTTLSEFPVEADCVKEINGSLVAVYESTNLADVNKETLAIGGSGDVEVPAGGYTLIVRGGANIAIASNIISNDESGPFGIIVLADGHEDSANVFIRPNVTNIAGLLYSEGAILSQSDDDLFYYGPGNASTTGLGNQLFWKGSIISRNTIGGVPNNVIPSGVTSCENYVTGISKPQCAQLFDLDYVRRFVVSTAIDPNTDEALGGITSNGVFFSGGGFCTGLAGRCEIPTQADSVITLNATGFIDTTPGMSRLDAFFIQQDNLPPPPGFTSGGGFTSSREIR